MGNTDLLKYLILAALVIGICYLYKNNTSNDISNEGEVDTVGNVDTSDEIAETIANEFANNYASVNGNEEGEQSVVKPNDLNSNNEGSFSNYPEKAALNFGRMEKPFNEEGKDKGIINYKNKQFRVTNQDSIKELNSDYYLPKAQRGDWFDTQPLQTTKQIRGTHLIHPKVWHGVNTVGGSLRNASHDIRGNEPVPKVNVSPWLNSTIDPDTNIMGVCNSY